MIKIGSGNWIVDNLNSALETWNGKLTEIWQLISTTPEEFKGGGVWNVRTEERRVGKECIKW